MPLKDNKRSKAKPVRIIGGTPEQEAFLHKLEREFTIDPENLRAIRDYFLCEMKKGLAGEDSTLAMIPSYVEGRLTGGEKGHFLALDLGGTNLRVVLVTLEGGGKCKTKSTKDLLNDRLKTGSIQGLCDHIAEYIDSFLKEQKLTDTEDLLHLGYTFSFPVLQSEINRGILKSWTKGFSCEGAVGKDPVMLLQDAFMRRRLPVKISAIVNDTVGTLLSHAYSKPSTIAGLIFGTGTNGAYIEKLANIGKWKGGNAACPEMIVNMEFGSFDNERRILPVTHYDNKVDSESLNPHSQIFEKMVSGMYLGEITRNILMEMMDRELIFPPDGAGHNQHDRCKAMSQQWAFHTSFMSEIEADDGDLFKTKDILRRHFELDNISTTECRIIKRICELVGKRAAMLAAISIAAIVQHCEVSQKEGADIGVDGSLYECYPSFEDHIYEGLEILLPEFPNVRKTVRLGLAKDGSGVGAALTACIGARMAAARTANS